MLRIIMKQGKGIPFIRRGRHRWFAVNDKDITAYSSMPRSFATDQEAWEHAEWALGASVTMRWENPRDPNDLFEQHARHRDFTN